MARSDAAVATCDGLASTPNPGAVERFLLDFAREARAAQPRVTLPPMGEPDYVRDRLDRQYYEQVAR